ncbi:MAG TPA: ABA4-like family protein [Ginsengibacter sp.]
MTPENIFSICSTVALAGWIILIFIPFWRSSDKFITGIIVTLFCIVYAWLIFSNFNFSDLQKFNSLQGVMELFTNKYVVTAGWIHYLAFDLMTGLFISRNALLHHINHWLITPCLLFTFMLGPVGLLFYFIIRLIITKKYFASNFSNSTL